MGLSVIEAPESRRRESGRGDRLPWVAVATLPRLGEVINPLAGLMQDETFQRELAAATKLNSQKQTYRFVADAAAFVVDRALYVDPKVSSVLRSSLLEAAALQTAEDFGKHAAVSSYLSETSPSFPIVDWLQHARETAEIQFSKLHKEKVTPAFERAVERVKLLLIKSSNENLNPNQLHAALQKVDGLGRMMTRVILSRLQPEVEAMEAQTSFGQNMLENGLAGDSAAGQLGRLLKHVHDNASQTFQRVQAVDLKTDILDSRLNQGVAALHNISNSVVNLVEAHALRYRQAGSPEETKDAKNAAALIKRFENAVPYKVVVDNAQTEYAGDEKVLYERYGTDSSEGIEHLVADPTRVLIRDLSGVVSQYASRIIRSNEGTIEKLSAAVRLFDPSTNEGRERIISTLAIAGMVGPTVGLLFDGKQMGAVKIDSSSWVAPGVDASYYPVSTVANLTSSSALPVTEIRATPVIQDTVDITVFPQSTQKSAKELVDQFSYRGAQQLAKGLISTAIGCVIGACASPNPPNPNFKPLPPVEGNPTKEPPQPDPTATVYDTATGKFEVMTPQVIAARNTAYIQTLNDLRKVPVFQDRPSIMAKPVDQLNLTEILNDKNFGIPIVVLAVGNQASPKLTFIIGDAKERMKFLPTQANGIFTIDVPGNLIVKTIDTVTNKSSTFSIPKPDFAISSMQFNAKTNTLDFKDPQGKTHSIPVSPALPTDVSFTNIVMNWKLNRLEYLGGPNGGNEVVAFMPIEGNGVGQIVKMAPPTPTKVVIVEAPTATATLTAELDREIAAKFIAGGEFAENTKQYTGRVFKDTKSGATILLSQKAADNLGNGKLNLAISPQSDWTKILAKNEIQLGKDDFVVFDEGGKVWLYREVTLFNGFTKGLDVISISDDGVIYTLGTKSGVLGAVYGRWTDDKGVVGFDSGYKLITSKYGVDEKTGKKRWLPLEYPVETNPEERVMQKRVEDWDKLNTDQRKALMTDWFDRLVARGGMVGFSPDQLDKFRKYVPLLAYMKTNHTLPSKFDNNKDVIYPYSLEPIPQLLFSYMKKIENNFNAGHWDNPVERGMKLDTRDNTFYSQSEVAMYIRWIGVIFKEAYTNKLALIGTNVNHPYIDRLAAIAGQVFLSDIISANDPLIDQNVRTLLSNSISFSSYFQQASQFSP